MHAISTFGCSRFCTSMKRFRTTQDTVNCLFVLVLVFLVSTLGEEGNRTMRWVTTEANVDHKRPTQYIMRNGRSPKILCIDLHSFPLVGNSTSCSRQQTRLAVRPFVRFAHWKERHHTLQRRKLTLATVTWQRTLFMGPDRQHCKMHAFCPLQHKISTIFVRC